MKDSFICRWPDGAVPPAKRRRAVPTFMDPLHTITSMKQSEDYEIFRQAQIEECHDIVSAVSSAGTAFYTRTTQVQTSCRSVTCPCRCSSLGLKHGS